MALWRWCIPVLPLLVVTPCWGGNSVQDLLERAYRAKREGSLVLAGEAMEQATLRMRAGPTKRALAAETAELWLAQDRGYRAVRLYRRLNYVRSEVDTLLLLEDFNSALAVARQVGYRRGEAIALAHLGSRRGAKREMRKRQTREAVRILNEEGLRRDKADLLFRVAKKYLLAADLYRELGDYYRLARSYELAGEERSASGSYKAAISYLKLDLETTQQRLLSAINASTREDLNLVGKERARRNTTLFSAKVSRLYEELAICYARQRHDRAHELVDLAIRYCQRQENTLLDGGTDASGSVLAEYFKLDDRLASLAELKKKIKGK